VKVASFTGNRYNAGTTKQRFARIKSAGTFVVTSAWLERYMPVADTSVALGLDG